MSVSEEKGKEAISICTTLGSHHDLSLVEVKLITGRTHQIRVHLQHKGTPVLGDPVYGSNSMNQKYRIYRQMLHAKQIIFTHPITSAHMDIIAPFPDDMTDIMQPFVSSRN